jgi:2-dehydropantoate 2-reductase
MRILIVGAGALGGLVGAYLTRAGEDVTLLEVNTARARLLGEAGLQITSAAEGEVRVNVNVVTSVADLPPFDLVFIAVKAYQTEEAVREVLPATGPRTRFLTMQNGIGNAETIARVVGPERTLCGITYNSIQHSGPGRLQFRAGVKPIQIAPFAGEVTPEIEAIGDLFRRAGLDTNVVAGIDHVVWQKLLHNAVINPVSAVTGLTCREILGDADLLAFMRDLCGEIVAVMRARGVPIVDEEDPFRPLMGSLKALGKNRPTMWQDLARGMRTEVDALNGAVVAEAERLGLSAPHNAALVRFVHSRERHKFLDKQEIARKLGLDRGASGGASDSASGSATVEPPKARPRPASARAGDGTPAPGPPLESTRRLKELIHAYYLDLDAASRASDRIVAACSSLAPVEIVRAMGLVPYFPENHAALISARGQAAACIARASAEGFSQFASSAMRTDIGASLLGISPLATAHGISGPPVPDVVVYSTNTGHELLRWFEFYGARYGVPVLGLHPPPALHELERIDIDAAVAQLLRLTSQLEKATGRTLDIDRLGEVVGRSAEAAALWGDILALGRSVPAPLTFFDTVVHLAPMLLLRGTEDAVDYYRLLKAEIEERIAEGVAAVPGECHRFYWDGPPIWHALRPLARLFADRGVAVVASTFCSVFTLPGLDPHNPVESMARAYTGVFGNRSEDYKTAFLAAQFEQYGVDGAVFHDCRTSPEASHVRYGLAVRAERLTGVPAFVIEADSHDPRLFSGEPLQGQLSDFLERQVEHVGAA